MANSIADIYGPTPKELEYQRRKEQEDQARQEYLAKLPSYGSEFGRYAGVARSGLETGNMLKNLRLFGESPSPEMDRATTMKQILSKYQGQDLSDPNVMAQISKELGQQGYPREAMQMLEQARARAASATSAAREAELSDLNLQEKRANVLKAQNEAAGVGTGERMTGKMIDEFLSKSDTANKYYNLASSFEDNFAGKGLDALGELKRLQARNFPLDEEDRRYTDWWMAYQEQVNAVRNDLFGSALTATEKTEFLKAMVTPGMDSKTVRRNLETQARIMRESYNKKVAAHKAQGWKTQGLENAVVGGSDTTSSNGEWSIRRK